MSAHEETKPTPGRLRHLAEEIRCGDSLQDVRSRFAELVSGVGTAGVCTLLLELVAEGVGRLEVRQLVTCYHEFAPEIGQFAECQIAGHPVETLQRENSALLERVELLHAVMPKLPGSPNAFAQARNAFRELSEVDNHYCRQEFLLFTRLEHRGLDRPGRILWAAHDEIRQWQKYLAFKLADDTFDADGFVALVDSVVEPLLADIQWISFLEERLLLPLACEALDETDWAIIHEYSPKIGWCLVEPGTSCRLATSHDCEDEVQASSEVLLPTGVLSVTALAEIHADLPVDLTFVDAEDRVRYFSEGSLPVFYRSAAILGRDARNCHPPRSVHYVDQVLADFKSGRESSAQFWKQMGDRFIHLRFVAIRDAEGAYQGTLEIAQDITQLRRLEGQRLELRYDKEAL